MDRLAPVTEVLLRFLIPLRDFVFAFVLVIELWLRAPLDQLGMPKLVQTAVLFAIAGFLALAATQWFVGLIRLALVAFLLLLAANVALSVIA